MKPAAALLIVTLIAYLPALRAGWIWDDDYYVTKNENLRTVEGLKNIWTKLGLRNGGTPQYYPVTHTTLWLEYRLYRLRPTGYHLVNVLLHATSAILLWIILRKLDVPGAWLAAALFALHPVHVESVAWVTERKNTLAGVFYLCALLLYLPLAGFAYEPARMRNRKLRYAIVLAIFVLALLSKSVTSSLPAAILLITWWKRGRVTRRDVLPLVPMFVLGIAMGILTSWMERVHVGAQGIEWEFSIWQRILIAGRAVWFYAMKLVAPLKLTFIYPRWDVDPREAWQWMFPLTAVALVVVLWRLRTRWGRGPLVAVLFFGGTLLPALGFVDLLPMRYSFVADHFQYLASNGLIVLFVGAAVTRWGERVRPVAAVILIVLGALTFRQTFIYRDLETLWRDTVAKNPTGWMPRYNLARIHLERGEVDQAEALLAEALRHNPMQPEPLISYGSILERRGRPADAFELYERSLVRGNYAVALANLGRMYLSAGQVDRAEEHLERAIAAEPKYAPAHTFMGLVRAGRGNLQGAVDSFRRAAELDPTSPEAWNNLGASLENLGDVAGAIEAYERALAADPSFEKARSNLDRARRSSPR